MVNGLSKTIHPLLSTKLCYWLYKFVSINEKHKHNISNLCQSIRVYSIHIVFDKFELNWLIRRLMGKDKMWGEI